MKTRCFLTFAILITLLKAPSVAFSQEPLRSGIYQIQSGTYFELGGFVGINEVSLPHPSQTFVSLDVGTGSSAQMSFLGADQKSVFQRLTNGVVSSNRIRFQVPTAYPFPFPPGVTAFADYTVTNAAGHLSINGTITSTVICCDIPYEFDHTNVIATFIPALALSVTNGIELRWSSASNQSYQLQWATDLVTWTNLGGPQPGNGSTNYATDASLTAPSQRFYRILTPP